MRLVREFKDITKHDAAVAGGKGASLGEMTRAAIPVPPGFVILAQAFDQFIGETGLAPEIETILGRVKHTEMHTVEQAAKEIQALILGERMPINIFEEIQKSFKNLGAEFVAVRSSATAEDSSAAAWAGQLDTFLNTSESDVLKNVQRCWASLFTPRAIFYRFEKNLHLTAISVAVVVQKMVQSEVSGVAFSVHPVTEDYNQLIIEAGFGLGEAIVSGQITPDSYVVGKNPRKIIDKNIAVQDRAIVRKGAGNEWISLREDQGGKPALSDAEILELSELILKIEQHYGFPCDIEWALEGGKFYITQSRPITTLMNKLSQEIVSKEIFEQGNSTDIIAKIKLLKWERWLERPFQAFVHSVFEDSTRKESFAEIGVRGVELRTMLFQRGFWYFNQEKIEEMDRQLAIYLETDSVSDITANLAVFKKSAENKLRALVKSDTSIETRFEEVLRILKNACTYIWLTHGLESFYQRKLNEEVPKYIKNNVEKFIGDASFPNKKTAQTLMEEAMRSRVDDETIASQFGWLRCRDGFSEPFTTKEIKRMRGELGQTAKHATPRIPQQLKSLFNKIRELVFFRTERTDVFYYLFYLARPIIQAMGAKYGIGFNEMRLYRAKSFLMGKPERYDDLSAFAYLDGTVLFQNEAIITEENDVKDGQVKGTVAYKGVVRGIVRVVKKVDQLDKVQAGDILVTQMTFPSFIPAMIRAAAFVTDEGGITCHAAIVAREMKKPCIIGTKNASRIFKDGDLVEVDADSGIVALVNSCFSKDNNIIKLEKIFSRERTFFYFAMWNDSDRMGFKDFLDYDLKNSLFLLEEGSGKVSVWQDVNEVNKINEIIADKLRQDSLLFKRLIKTLNSEWKHIEKFVEGMKMAKKVDEIKYYYSHLVRWWSAMTVVFNIPNIPGIAPIILEKSVKYRAKMEKYSAVMDAPLRQFWITNFPQYKDCVSVIMPDEVFCAAVGSMKADQFKGIRKRLNGFAVFNSKPYLLPELYNKLNDSEIKLQRQTIDTSSVELKGFSAFDGKIVGRVRLVLFKNQIADLQVGEVLVSDMTAPDYLPAMKKAVAFVTDEGGITCHAAIVAREMKKPCVIGTKFATKVLKNGDLVEVDAKNGMVRKIVFQVDGSIDLSQYNLVHAVEREYPPFLSSLFSDAVCDSGRYRKAVEIDAALRIYTAKNNRYSVSLDDQNLLKDLLQERDLSDSRYLDRISRRCYLWGSRFLRLGKKLNKKRYSRLSIDAIYKDVRKFVEGYKDVGPFLQYVVYIDQLLKIKLDKLIKEKSQNPEQDFIILGGPDKENFDFLEGRDLLKIAVKAEGKKNWQQNRIILGLIDRHAQHYGWIATRGGSKNPPWNRQLIIGRLEGLIEKDPVATLKHHLAGRAECRQLTKRLLLQYGANVEERALIRHIKDYVYLRTYRTDMMGLVAYLARPLFTELGKRFCLTYWQVMALVEKELFNLAAVVPDKQELDARLRAYNFVHIGHDDVVIHSVKNSDDEVKFREKVVSGQCGFTGKIQGRVKVVRDSVEQSKVEEGDILVAVMTFPNLIPAMERATAFITDEGGILCHAAIIAREMKKPCVIGTKIATQVFRDGDMVEVDAEKGIVTII